MSEPCTCALSQVTPLTPALKEALVEYYGEEFESLNRRGKRRCGLGSLLVNKTYYGFAEARGLRPLTLEEVKHLLSQH